MLDMMVSAEDVVTAAMVRPKEDAVTVFEAHRDLGIAVARVVIPIMRDAGRDLSKEDIAAVVITALITVGHALDQKMEREAS